MAKCMFLFVLLPMLMSACIVGLCACAGATARQSEVRLSLTGEPEAWNCKSALVTDESAAALRQIANSQSFDRGARAKAVCTLFANFVRPGDDSIDTSRSLGRVDWLTDSELHGVRELAGWVPITWNVDRTVFAVCVCDGSWRQDQWIIYFSLSGEQTDANALEFLRGQIPMNATRLIEFAICFPLEHDDVHWRTRYERFAKEGVAVFYQGL